MLRIFLSFLSPADLRSLSWDNHFQLKILLFLLIVSDLDVGAALREAGEDEDHEKYLSDEDSLEYIAGCITRKVKNH